MRSDQLPPAFFQEAPRLGNQFDDDVLLAEYLARALPEEVRRAIEPELRELGEEAGGHWFRFQQADRENEPVLTNFDPWGHRIDHIEVSPLWKEAQKAAARWGMVAAAYEARFGEHARRHQMLVNYLASPSLDVYSCPLAMTDGATRTLLDLGNQALIDRAVPRLTSRDPAVMWTSGQWMTERTGGSDVGLTRTVALRDEGSPGGTDRFRLWGNKWFTSATTAEMALTLARPEGNGEGGKGLALFYLETRDEHGALNGIRIDRLKDKLGTRKVPTAELSLEGALALPVAGLGDGIRNISSMLNVTRTWNAVAAVSGMRRAMALVADYSRRREQFGALLVDKPLHVDTVAGMQAEFEGAFHLAFRVVELFGRKEAGVATDEEERLWRLVTPLAKLTTGKQAVAIASEALECFGGAGYIEDTGLPVLLRDAQVLPIWEGTTNVLSLDTLRALAKEGTFESFGAEVSRLLATASDPALRPAVERAKSALGHATEWLGAALTDRRRTEAGARRFALSLGRTLELSLLCAHAAWSSANGGSPRATAAARRFARHGVDLIVDAEDEADSLALRP